MVIFIDKAYYTPPSCRQVGLVHSSQLQTGGLRQYSNKASYMATPVACGWAGAVKEKITRAIWQEGLAQTRLDTWLP